MLIHNLWDHLLAFLPGVTPGVSRSTMKPLNALLAGHLGSGLVRARTKYLQMNTIHLNVRKKNYEHCCGSARDTCVRDRTQVDCVSCVLLPGTSHVGTATAYIPTNVTETFM